MRGIMSAVEPLTSIDVILDLLDGEDYYAVLNIVYSYYLSPK